MLSRGGSSSCPAAVALLVFIWLTKSNKHVLSYNQITVFNIIYFEVISDRWTAINGNDGRLLAWGSWYCFDLASIELVKTHGLLGCIDSALPLFFGHECYISLIAVDPLFSTNNVRLIRSKIELLNRHCKYTYTSITRLVAGRIRNKWLMKLNRYFNYGYELR